MARFEEDLNLLMEKMNVDEEVNEKLCELKANLTDLYKSNLVKINHSVMEFLCAKHLILKRYKVDVEYRISDILTCDLYGVKGDGSTIVEIETGFTPPSHALDPATYNRARIASKIARYSLYSNKFSLGAPLYYILQIHPAFTAPPRYRTEKELLEIKTLCDQYYKNPPINLDEIRNSRLHTIYLIDVDTASIREIDPEAYLEATSTVP